MVDILSVSINYLLLTVAFIAMGRVFYHDIIPTVKSGFVESKVLKSGIAVNADIINVHQTTAWGGNKPIYMLTFHYETHDGVEYESSIKKLCLMRRLKGSELGMELLSSMILITQKVLHYTTGHLFWESKLLCVGLIK